MAKLTAASPRPPSLVVHTEAGDVAVEPSVTPGGPACLYQAYCTGCGATYPGPSRARPTARPRQLPLAIRTPSPQRHRNGQWR